MIDRLIRYFDLQSHHRVVRAEGHDATPLHAPVLPQYLIVSFGVIVEPYLRRYHDTGMWKLDCSNVWGRVVFGLIVGIVILPGIYKSTFDTTKPIVVQMFALFPLGLGWQTLFASATKAVGV